MNKYLKTNMDSPKRVKAEPSKKIIDNRDNKQDSLKRAHAKRKKQENVPKKTKAIKKSAKFNSPLEYYIANICFCTQST